MLRVQSEAGPRYLIVDYKTNWLGPMDEPLTAHSYRPEALAGAMGHSDYPLQALLYAAVLHRFLRWRQPGYDPAVHLGGVLYLYLRGMCGPDTPLVDGSPCGVFAWQPPVALVEELSDLLDGCRRMTELWEPTGEHDWRFATGSAGLLAAFNAAGVLTSTDLHVATRIGVLGGEDDERVLLAVALAVRAVRRGSVCLDLALAPETAPELPWPDDWAAARSPVVAALPLGAPRAWSALASTGLLYLDRYHRLETQVHDDLAAPPRAGAAPGRRDAAGRCAGEGARRALQRRAGGRGRRRRPPPYDDPHRRSRHRQDHHGRPAARAARRPGRRHGGGRLAIALAAPTGKAATRLQEAVVSELADVALTWPEAPSSSAGSTG